MWIIDLTHLIRLNKLNYYCFNPSFVHLKENIYVLVYRVVQYDIPIECHPWKIWDGGYKYFDNSLQVMQKKYRTDYGGERTICIEDRNYIELSSEFDSTGIAFLNFDGHKFSVIHNVNNIFGKEMNQDARIIKIGSEYVISYNVFEIKEDKTYVRHRYRYIELPDLKKSSVHSGRVELPDLKKSSAHSGRVELPDLKKSSVHSGEFIDNQIKLSKEYMMFDHKYKSVEKNCVFDQKMNVIYSIGKTFDILIDKSCMSQIPIPQLEKLIKHYGEKNIEISSSTPPIPYGKNSLAVGHIKIAYKNISNICPFNKFFKLLDFSVIHRHGKYIYFMFLYVFDANYKIIKLSNPFIPSVGLNHLPYVLVFPAGLCDIDGKVAITYGEGDCKCKILILNQTEVKNLLVDDIDLGFYFLTNSCKIQHYGYFGHLNCGDDAFQLVFNYLRQKYYPHFGIEFTGTSKIDADLTIIGGGDVINKYFMDEISKYVKPNANFIAAGVGIPYTSGEHYLENFKEAILRNPRDYAKLKDKYNVSYVPDLTFLLPKIINVKTKYENSCKKIGLCLTRTYYKVGYEDLYDNFIKEITNFIKLILIDSYIVHLIPFCINQNNKDECDLLLLTEIKKHFSTNKSVIVEHDASYTKDNYVEKTYRKIAEMDFNICTRFHSHIFSMIHQVPFVSLTCGRKCIEFMTDIELTNNLYRLKTNDKDLPIEFSAEKFHKFVKDKINNRVNIKKKLTHFMSKYSELMNQFEKTWSKMIFKYTSQTHRIQLFPKLSATDIVCGKDDGDDDNHHPTSPPIHPPHKPCHPSHHSPHKHCHPTRSDDSNIINITNLITINVSTEPPDFKKSSVHLFKAESEIENKNKLICSHQEKSVNEEKKYINLQENTKELAHLKKQPQIIKPDSLPKNPEPVYVQKNPEPVYVQKNPEPAYVQKNPEPAYVQKNPEPVYVQKNPEPMYVQKNPEPVYVQKNPEPVYVQKNKEPMYVQKKPVYVQKKPVYVQEKPVYVQEKLVHVQEKPVYVQEKLIYVQEKPTYVQERPYAIKPVGVQKTRMSEPVYVQEEPIYIQERSQTIKPVYVQKPRISEPVYVQSPGVEPVYVQSPRISEPVYVQSPGVEPVYVQQPYANKPYYVKRQPQTTQSTYIQEQSYIDEINYESTYVQAATEQRYVIESEMSQESNLRQRIPNIEVIYENQYSINNYERDDNEISDYEEPRIKMESIIDKNLIPHLIKSKNSDYNPIKLDNKLESINPDFNMGLFPPDHNRHGHGNDGHGHHGHGHHGHGNHGHGNHGHGNHGHGNHGHHHGHGHHGDYNYDSNSDSDSD